MVSQEFLNQMKAPVRRVDARVTIDYTDPTQDQTIEVTASEQANASYPAQTADFATEPAHKWAALDGAWVLDGTWHLAPVPEDAYLYQMGWWSAQVAGEDGRFSEPYPTLILTHPARPVITFQVVGDYARGEWPIEFAIRLYGPDGTLLRERVVTGNAEIQFYELLVPPALDVTRQELEIRAWSHPGRHAKILEFFTSLQETYEGNDLLEVHLLEESESGSGVGTGGVSTNEITVRLVNRGGRFDVTNPQSPLRELLRPNRCVRAWLGVEGAKHLWGEGWYAPFDRDLTLSRQNGAVIEPLPDHVVTRRPGEGRFGGAVAVEEGTTNQIFVAGYQSWFASLNIGDSTDRSVGGGTIRVTRLGEHRYRAEVIADCTYPSLALTNNFTWPANQPHTISAYILDYYEAPGTTGRFGLGRRDFGFPSLHGADGLGRKTHTHQDTQDINTGFAVRSSNDLIKAGTYIEWEFAQVELNKPFATSFVAGTRAAGKLEYPQPLNKKRGTFSVWINPHVVRNWNNFFLMSVSTGRFLLYFGADGWSKWDFGPLNSGPGTPAGTIVAGQWAMHTLTWDADAGVYRYYVNGEFVGERQYVEPDSLPSALPTVTNYGALIDELLILPYAASEEHIAELYRETRPLYDEWVPLGTYWSGDWDSQDLEAMVRGRDRIELLRRTTYEPGPLKQNVSLYELAQDVLAHAEMPPETYWLDPGLQDIVVPWGWVPSGSHRDALRVIAEAGMARVYCDRDGILRIKQVTAPTGGPVLEITKDDYFPPARNPVSSGLVANRVVVTTQPLVPAASLEEVYRASVEVPAGQVITMKVEYEKRPVIDAAASLESPPAGVSIIEASYGATGAEVQIRNTGASMASVTLAITGRPLSVEGGEQVVEEDDLSIRELGLIVHEVPTNPLVQTSEHARAVAQAILARSAQQRRDVELEWRGNPALEVDDVVSVDGMQAQVVRQELSWAGALSARITARRLS